MSAITSLYIAHVEKQYNAEFIADLFSRSDLAQVSRVFIEPYKSNNINRSNYNRVYVQIDFWHESEAAYSFIRRLRNPSAEARLVYSGDNWWAVDINRYPSKLISNNSVLTIFSRPNEADEVEDTSSTVAVGNVEEDVAEEFGRFDAMKTDMLRNIVASFKENSERELMEQEEIDAAEYEAYLREMNWMINSACQGITSDMFDEVFGY